MMLNFLCKVINFNRKGVFKIFLEEDVSTNTLKKENIDKMNAVREFIVKNLNETTSLIDLAHQAGTNEFTLKKGFKELFGTIVFGFWNAFENGKSKKTAYGNENKY